MTPLKEIRYRGGVVTFRIPSNWREEYGPDGGGEFYEDAPDSGTFRIQVITAKAPFPITRESGPDILSSLRQASVGIERLSNGCALIRYTQTAEDRGHRLFITYWAIANPIPPSHGRVATFSYTMLDHQKTDPRFQRELALMDEEVRKAVFADELGIQQK